MARTPLQGKKKSVLTAVFIVLAILAAGGVGIWLRTMQDDKAPGKGGTGQLVDKRSDETKRAQGLALSGKTDEASKYVNDQLAKNDLSDSQKYDLYLQQGVILYEQNKVEDALASYKKAEAVKQTREIYELMADAATDLGKNQEAISYLKEAIKRIDKNSPVRDVDRANKEDRIRALGGSI